MALLLKPRRQRRGVVKIALTRALVVRDGMTSVEMLADHKHPPRNSCPLCLCGDVPLESGSSKRTLIRASLIWSCERPCLTAFPAKSDRRPKLLPRDN